MANTNGTKELQLFLEWFMKEKNRLFLIRSSQGSKFEVPKFTRHQMTPE